MIKISVIIPVYNVADYLPNCLDSILNQSVKEVEIICVNDGSSDNSLEILKDYEKKDKRVIIIDKENEGSGVARNAGLAIANGKYVYFVDGDDWLEANSLEHMLKKAEDLNTDILIFGGLSYYQEQLKGKSGSCHSELVSESLYKKQKGGYSADKLPQKYLNKVFSAKDIKKDIFKFPSTAWTKLYKRTFLEKNNIKFQPIMVGQDQLPFFHSMITAEKIAVLPENLYCYRKNRKGAVTAVKKKKNFSPIYVFYGIEELLKNISMIEDYKYVFINRYFSKATSWLAKFDNNLKQGYFDEYSKLLEHIKKEYPNGWWVKFNPKINDGYWNLKAKQFFAKNF